MVVAVTSPEMMRVSFAAVEVLAEEEVEVVLLETVMVEEREVKRDGSVGAGSSRDKGSLVPVRTSLDCAWAEETSRPMRSRKQAMVGSIAAVSAGCWEGDVLCHGKDNGEIHY